MVKNSFLKLIHNLFLSLRIALSSNAKILFNILLVIGVGYAGGFIAASAILILVLLFISKEEQLFFLLGVFLFTFILGDNFKDALGFAQNLRFVVLGLSILLLIPYNLLSNNPGNLFLGFTIYVFAVTLSISPLGKPAALRALGYLVVSLTVFKLFSLLIEHARLFTVNLIVLILFLFFALNIFLYFVPIYGNTMVSGRFSGLMANPNGLGLLAMFVYALMVFIRDHEENDFSKNFYIFFQLLLLSIIIFTGSRTALISVLGFEFVLRVRQNPLLLFLAIFGTIAINITLNQSAILDSLSNSNLSDRLRLETLETGSGRTEVWKVAYEEFKANPYVGKGMMYDDYFIKEYSDRMFGKNKARQWNGVWNSYLSLGLNVGVIGMILFGYVWYRLYRISVYPVFRMAFLAMCLVSAVTESWMAASMNAFMPIVLLIWAFQIYPSTEE